MTSASQDFDPTQQLDPEDLRFIIAGVYTLPPGSDDREVLFAVAEEQYFKIFNDPSQAYLSEATAEETVDFSRVLEVGLSPLSKFVYSVVDLV